MIPKMDVVFCEFHSDSIHFNLDIYALIFLGCLLVVLLFVLPLVYFCARRSMDRTGHQLDDDVLSDDGEEEDEKGMTGSSTSTNYISINYNETTLENGHKKELPLSRAKSISMFSLRERDKDKITVALGYKYIYGDKQLCINISSLYNVPHPSYGGPQILRLTLRLQTKGKCPEKYKKKMKTQYLPLDMVTPVQFNFHITVDLIPQISLKLIIYGKRRHLFRMNKKVLGYLQMGFSDLELHRERLYSNEELELDLKGGEK